MMNKEQLLELIDDDAVTVGTLHAYCRENGLDFKEAKSLYVDGQTQALRALFE